MRYYRFSDEVKYFFKENYIIVYLILIIFLLGIFFGALSLKTLNVAQKVELVSYLKAFFQGFTRQKLQSLSMVML